MKKNSVLICFFIFFFAAACAINPVTGKRELSLISEKSEISLGQDSDKEIRVQFGVYDAPALNTYVENIGLSLAPYTHRPQLEYHFAVLDTPVVNAFALPGGYIYVTRGILAMMNSEAELAAVLGHELGHVNARHSVKRLSQMMLVELGLIAGGALSETFAKISGAASIGIQLLFLKYSRDDERQADQLGIEYARKGNYNPAEMVNFFSSLQSLGDLSGGHGLPGFLSTHPLENERIQNTKSKLMASDSQLRTNHIPYLNQIDDMVYGDDPRQGYVENSTFYHPLLRFSFSFPKDWNVQNTHSQVVLASKDGNAALVLKAEETSERLRDYAQKTTESIEGKQFIGEQDLNINGMESYQQLYDIVKEDEDTLRLRMSLVRKGPYVFSFFALSRSSDFSKYDFQFGTTVGSFDELRSENHLDRQPNRLRLVTSDGTKALEQMFQNLGMKKDLWPLFAILNGRKLDQTPEPNALIKVIK